MIRTGVSAISDNRAINEQVCRIRPFWHNPDKIGSFPDTCCVKTYTQIR